MTILYKIDNSLYVNITNRCPCSCTFCIRKNDDEVKGSGSLWLEREPTLEEIINEFEKYDLSNYDEVVFCGYGEPLVRISEVVEVCKYLRAKSKIAIRVNTNGLANLVHGRAVEKELAGLVDSVSISLNAPTAEEYFEIAKPVFGLKSFDGLLSFAREVKKYIPKVTFSVVDVISKDEISKAKELSEKMGIPLRIREKE